MTEWTKVLAWRASRPVRVSRVRIPPSPPYGSYERDDSNDHDNNNGAQEPHRVADFERLNAWRRAHELALLAYRLTRGLPDAERFGLTDQIRRAAVAVPAFAAFFATSSGLC